MRGNAAYAEVTHQVDATKVDAINVEVIDESNAEEFVKVKFTFGEDSREAVIKKGSSADETPAPEAEAAEQEAPSEEQETQKSEEQSAEAVEEAAGESEENANGSEAESESETPAPEAEAAEQEAPKKQSIADIRKARTQSTMKLRGELTAVNRRRMSPADKLAKWINERRNIKASK
jgi:hypothetical protein